MRSCCHAAPLLQHNWWPDADLPFLPQVLYIYDNLLSSISSIASSRLLTHLVCHNNQLTSLQGLQHLPLLEKLHAHANCLTAVTCLTKAQHLRELHVSDQHAWAPAAASQHPH